MNWEQYRKALDQHCISDAATTQIINNLKSNKCLSQQKHYKYPAKKWIPTAVATCFVIVASVIGLNYNNVITPKLHEQGQDNYNTTIVGDTTLTDESKSTNNTEASNHSVVESSTEIYTTQNVIDIHGSFIWNEVSSASQMLYRNPDAKSEMCSFDKFVEYLGYNPEPTFLPEGYKKDFSDSQELFFEPNGKPTDYYSFYSLRYSSEKGSVNIRISKAQVDAHSDVPISGKEMSVSDVNGIKVTLMKNVTSSDYEESESAVYMASFSINNVNYYAFTQGELEANDFIKIITTLKR